MPQGDCCCPAARWVDTGQHPEPTPPVVVLAQPRQGQEVWHLQQQNIVSMNTSLHHDGFWSVESLYVWLADSGAAA